MLWVDDDFSFIFSLSRGSVFYSLRSDECFSDNNKNTHMHTKSHVCLILNKDEGTQNFGYEENSYYLARVGGHHTYKNKWGKWCDGILIRT